MSQPDLSADTAHPTAYSVRDRALIYAWESISEYASASGDIKKWHTRLRLTVIILTAMVAIFATLSTALNATDLTSVSALAATIMRVSLIVIPFVISGILAFSLQIGSNASWIAYRMGEQIIRSAVYLYRMKVDRDGVVKSQKERQDALIEVVDQAKAYVKQYGTTQPFMSDKLQVDHPRNLSGVYLVNGDDGVSHLTVNQYITFRLEEQAEWYISKVKTEYANLRLLRAVTIVVTALGSVVTGLAALAGLDLGWVVSITTAVGVALTMYIDLKMHGRTYGIYNETAEQLRVARLRWQVAQDQRIVLNQQPTGEEVADFVLKVESILEKERVKWVEIALQAQEAVEKALAQNYNTRLDAPTLTAGETAQNAAPPTASPALSSAVTTPTTQETVTTPAIVPPGTLIISTDEASARLAEHSGIDALPLHTAPLARTGAGGSSSLEPPRS